ncbi:MAG: hypothetical protein CVU03_01425 [Bacteroidetes bacterium HGW-Bacteroidetes-2]|jgi:hypothetical protein|nr:MAG: hypothetical protein CVU03_01425 [Bacteroidetes bacterium HGW-Bacteroidetes-2]
MKNLNQTITILAATLLLFASCSKNDDFNNPLEGISVTPPTAAAFKALQENAFNNLKQTATFDAATGIVFTSERGVKLTIVGGCLTLNENSVTGLVHLEYVEIFEKGNMLTTNATTVALDENNEKQTLTSGGEFHIKAYQNGNELSLGCGGMFLSVPTSITGGAKPEMGPFSGVIDENDNLIWLPQTSEFWIVNQDNMEVYNAFVENFGWFNCDKFISYPDPKTNIQISLPEGFNLNNAKILIARIGDDNSLAFMYGQFPIGLQAHIIFLSEHEGDFRYAIKTITVVDGQLITFTIEETSVASLEAVTQIINALP